MWPAPETEEARPATAQAPETGLRGGFALATKQCEWASWRGISASGPPPTFRWQADRAARKIPEQLLLSPAAVAAIRAPLAELLASFAFGKVVHEGLTL